MPKILCCGEALIDMLPCMSDTGLPGFTPLAGGAVFNTSIALGRLGVTTELFTGLSSDLFGDILRQSLPLKKIIALCLRGLAGTLLAAAPPERLCQHPGISIPLIPPDDAGVRETDGRAGDLYVL